MLLPWPVLRGVTRGALRLLPVGCLVVLLSSLALTGRPVETAAASSLAASASSRTPDVPDGSVLRDPASGKSYVVYAEVRHLVQGADTLTALGLSTSAVMTATTTTLAALPTGTTLGVHYAQGQPWPFSLIQSGPASIFVNPPAASAGTIVQISGAHFGASETVQIRYSHGEGALDVTAGAAGDFSTSIFLPPDEPLETMVIYAYGTRSGALAVQPFTIIALAPPPTLTAAPVVTSPRGVTRLSGTGFAPGERVNAFLGNGLALARATADAQGNFPPRAGQWLRLRGRR
jgi:hypothetical protein